jgi:hypothetical protein
MSLRYKLLGVPTNLDELVDRMKRKGETKVYVWFGDNDPYRWGHRDENFEFYMGVSDNIEKKITLEKCAFSRYGEDNPEVKIKAAKLGQTLYRKTIALAEQLEKRGFHTEINLSSIETARRKADLIDSNIAKGKDLPF